MKEINLISLIQAYDGLSQPLFEGYINIFNINPKKNELQDLDFFVKDLQKYSSDVNVLDSYFFGYTIPQISKEFDLLRFGTDCIVNIELKSSNTGAKIYKQIIRNQYYLGFLGKIVYVFTYVSDEKKLYTLDENQTLVPVDFKLLLSILSHQIVIEVPNIDNLFNPSNYLVSPFNSTDEFVNSKYFLTDHQEEIKKKCINEINKKGISFLSIIGKAGTGKTLLTFDIAKEYISSKHKVLVIHCGILNQGHLKLRDSYGWDIIPMKDCSTRNITDYHIIVIDETQRTYPHQLRFLINIIKKNGGNCIFSYDKQQCLRIWEVDNDIPKVISEETSSQVFQLTEKIRTNKEIASFIISLFNKRKTVEKLNRDNVELKYFQNSKDAKKYIKLLGEQGWKIINYTPSSKDIHPYNEYAVSMEDNAHGVIGQEFDKVIAVIDQYFCYVDDNLSIKNYKQTPYYHPVKMLFQIMTRTRKKLSIVIISNDEILERCLHILNSTV